MTTRSNRLTHQVGKYLVACELARKGLIVETLSDNVPGFDLIATGLNGTSYPIQVKAIKGKNWQFSSIKNFFEVIVKGNKQRIRAKKRVPARGLVYVFVLAAEEYGKDQFYVLKWAEVQDILIANYERWLDLHRGVRPRNPKTLHCAIAPSDLKNYKDKWSIITHGL